LPNIEKIRFSKPPVISSSSINSVITNADKNHLIFTATPTPKASLPTPVHSTSFSNRADIEAFQQKKEPIRIIKSPIESNEIDLTKLVRDTYSNNTYVIYISIIENIDFYFFNHFIRSNQFQFSKISQNWRQQKTTPTPLKRIPKQTRPCDEALLAGANKRFVLLYNMNVSKILYVFDVQKDETKEFQWDEGILVRKNFLYPLNLMGNMVKSLN
jgi:hypothetical protein